MSCSGQKKKAAVQNNQQQVSDQTADEKTQSVEDAVAQGDSQKKNSQTSRTVSYDTFINPGLSISRFFFELTRYYSAGFSLVPSSSSLITISALPEQISLHCVWNETLVRQKMAPLLVCETGLYDLRGIIESTYCEDDLYAPRETVTSGGEKIATTIDWVDKVLLALNAEPSGLAGTAPDNGSEILSTLDDRSGKGISTEETDSTKQSDSHPVERVYENQDSHLRRFTYGKEQFAVSDVNGTRMLISTADKQLVRRTFDERLRLVKKEKWTLGADSRSSVLDSTTLYSYQDDYPTPQNSVEEQPVKKVHAETSFDEKGRRLSYSLFHYPEKSDTPAQIIPDSKIVWTYDEQGRVLTEEKILYKYSVRTNGKTDTKQGVTKTEYAYTGKGPLPDSSFYENDKLRMKTVYEDQSSYTESMYFDGGIIVETSYKHGIKKSEIIMQNGKQQRRRDF